MGAVHVEIPAASAGMTEWGAGRAEEAAGMTRKGGANAAVPNSPYTISRITIPRSARISASRIPNIHRFSRRSDSSPATILA